MTKRMKANSHFSHTDHGVEHEYNRYCDEDEPRCEPVEFTYSEGRIVGPQVEPVAFVAVKQRVGELYIIQAKDFDPKRQERQDFMRFDDHWTDAAVPLSFCQTRAIVVRDKPKPRMLEEIISRALSLSAEIAVRASGSCDAFARGFANVLREAFPELKDK